ncbi:hypothetical protein [Actinokineospora enzanensis]|uniref:hypothetical protein n=1 Tax=Actinokineospora enzanensis TaxID=155975 RepID=UPI00036D5D4B|nr:hypothetical protein [Actinokineospora enzanensis]
MSEKYLAIEKAALIALMMANREVSNTELKTQYGVPLDKPGRERLNKDGLLRSRTDRKPFVHEITKDGIAWCERELVRIEPAAKSGLARVVLDFTRAVLDQVLAQGSIFGFLHPGVAHPDDLESLIVRVYRELSVKPQDWVRLAKLRPALNGADKAEVDEVLLAMLRAGGLHLAPDSNRKALVDVDHAAAIRIGGEDKHLMAIEES